MLPKRYDPANYNGKIWWNENDSEIKEKGNSITSDFIIELSPKILEIVQSYNINNILVEEDLVQEANIFVLQYFKENDVNIKEDKEKIISNIKERIYTYIYEKIENMPEMSKVKPKDKKRIIRSLMLEKTETNSKILQEEHNFTQNDIVTNETEMPEENLLHQETLEKLEEAFNKLPEHEAKTIKLYYGIGCAPVIQKDIATELGVTSTSISNYLKSGTKKMKRIMQNINGIKTGEEPSAKELELIAIRKKMYEQRNYEQKICQKSDGTKVEKEQLGYIRLFYNLFGELPKYDLYIGMLKETLNRRNRYAYKKDEIIEKYYGIETKRHSIKEIVDIMHKCFYELYSYEDIIKKVYYENVRIKAEMSGCGQQPVEADYYEKEKQRIMEEYGLKEHEAIDFMLNGYFIIENKTYSKRR